MACLKLYIFVCGHFHIRQDNKNIHYIGSPYHKDRGDRGNAKGITVLDFDTGETRFIENEVSPRFMKESIYDLINLTVGQLMERWNNNRIELHMKSSDQVRCNFDDLKEAMCRCFKSFDAKGDEVISEVEKINEASFNDAKSSDDYMDDYLGNQDVSDDMRKRVWEKMNEYKERL